MTLDAAKAATFGVIGSVQAYNTAISTGTDAVSTTTDAVSTTTSIATGTVSKINPLNLLGVPSVPVPTVDVLHPKKTALHNTLAGINFAEYTTTKSLLIAIGSSLKATCLAYGISWVMVEAAFDSAVAASIAAGDLDMQVVRQVINAAIESLDVSGDITIDLNAYAIAANNYWIAAHI